MFRNYFKISLRSLLRQKFFSFINIAGLAIGMACCILIFLYVQYELSFDCYHENAGRIYRVVVEQPGNVFLGSDHFAVTQAILGPILKREFPEVLHAVTLDDWKQVLVNIGNQNFYENGFLWANSEIFDVFTFPLLLGDPETALADPFSIVLSRSLAQKYFGEENPLGKVIRIEAEHEMKVTGVMQDVPQNSHFHFDMVASFKTLVAISENKRQFSDWGSSSVYTYILVPPDFDPKAFETKLAQIVKKYHTEPWRDPKRPHRYYLQPLTDIHLHSHINFDIARTNDIRHIYLLSGLALIVLLIACINYTNLTTARASLRAREVGVRKVVGADRLQLGKQFVGESLLIATFAAAVAMLFVELLLPAFSNLVDRNLSLSLIMKGEVIWIFLLTVVSVGLISGIYPAVYLAGFQPVKVLKGDSKENGRPRLRSVLVIGQFAASVALVVCTMVVQKQLYYIKNKELGYDREHVLVVPMRDPEVRRNFRLIKHDLLQNPNIARVTASEHLPTNITSQTSLGWARRHGNEALKSYQTNVELDFLDLFKIELVEGRNFSAEFASDSVTAYIINEKLRDLLGWETGVGKPFGTGDRPDGIVIGVTKNFHFHSFRQEIHPLFIQLDDHWHYASTYLTKYSIFIIFWHYAKKTAQNRNQV